MGPMSLKMKEEVVTVAEIRKEIEKLTAHHDKKLQPLINFLNNKLDASPAKEDAATIVLNAKDQTRIIDLCTNATAGCLEDLVETFDGTIANQKAGIQEPKRLSAFIKATDPRNRIHQHEPKSDYKFH
jgi:hypothetical protein